MQTLELTPSPPRRLHAAPRPEPFTERPEDCIESSREALVRSLERGMHEDRIVLGCSDFRTTHAHRISLPGSGLAAAMGHREAFGRMMQELLRTGRPVTVQSHDDCAVMHGVARDTGMDPHECAAGWRTAVGSELGAVTEHLPLHAMRDGAVPPVIYLDTTRAFDPSVLHPGYRITVVTPDTLGFVARMRLFGLFGVNAAKPYIGPSLSAMGNVVRARAPAGQRIVLAVVRDSGRKTLSNETERLAQEIADRDRRFKTVVFDDRGRIGPFIKPPEDPRMHLA